MRLPIKQKKEAVLKVIKKKESISKIAREYGIARKTIYEWIKRYQLASKKEKKFCIKR
jgi:transposase-like protein